jgi:integrase
MPMHNPANERTKRRYFAYMKEARRYSEASLDMVAKAIHRFETHSKFRDFKSFHIEQAVAFKRHLSEQRGERSGDRLSKATIHSTLTALRNFFFWLAGQPGFRSRLSYSDAEYFNASEKDVRASKATSPARVPTLEQVLKVLDSVPGGTEIEMRDRAIIAFILLTGARDGAVASLKIKHVDLRRDCVVQDAREVATKFSKSFTTFFFPVGERPRMILDEWVAYLTHQKLWGLDDPLFPATKVAVGAGQHFEATGLDRRHWSDATPIRSVFKRSFEHAGLPYFNPHSFRKTLVTLGQRICRTPEEIKAWSQNLGHEQVMTTFNSYGSVAEDRQAEILRGLSEAPSDPGELAELLEKVVQAVRRQPA